MPTIIYRHYGRNSVEDVLNVGAPVPKIRQVIFTEAADLVNVDPDNDGGCSRRGGYVQRYAGDVRTMFANDDIFLFQEGGTLRRFDAETYGATFLNLAIDPASELNFCEVNGLVMYSDGTMLRKVHQGVDHGLTAPTGEFKEATPAGQVMAEFYRKLLVGVDDVLCVTDPDTVDYMDSRLCRFPLGAPLLMIGPVDDGVYVSTVDRIYFLAGRNQMEWSQPGNVRKVADYPAIPGTMVRLKAEKTGLEKVDGNLVMFATPMGYCYGLNGGVLLNATMDKVRPGEEFVSGTAILREQGRLRHYLTVLRTAAGAFHGEVVNTKTQGCGRYDEFEFRKIVQHKGREFGCNAAGIFELTGNTDAGQPIQAGGISGVSSCGTDAVKFFPVAHVVGRCAGQMEFSLAVDEKPAKTYPVTFAEGRDGVHRKQRRLAGGVTGGYAQVSWRNVDGCDFYLQQTELDVLPTNSKVR